MRTTAILVASYVAVLYGARDHGWTRLAVAVTVTFAVGSVLVTALRNEPGDDR